MPETALLVSVVLGVLCLSLIFAGAASLVLMVKGAVEARRQRACSMDDSCTFLLEPQLVPDVAMIATPPDASEESRLYVRRLLKLHSESFEVILVLDGPSDSDLDIWKKAFHLKATSRPVTAASEAGKIQAVYKSLQPIRLTVVDRERGGTAACLNTGVMISDAPMIGTVDVDAEFSEDALLRLVRPMVTDPENTIAVCGGAPAGPAPGLAARLYRLESVRTWLGRCAGLSAYNALLPAPGSFLLMQRDAVIQAGGFRGGSLDMIVHLHALARLQERPYSVRFVPTSSSRPATPLSMEKARAMRSRDRADMRKALGRHIRLLTSFDSLGWVALPGLLWACYLRPAVKFAVVVLAILALSLRYMDVGILIPLLVGTIAFEVLVSMSAAILHEYALQPEAGPGELADLFLSAIQEKLSYRL